MSRSVHLHTPDLVVYDPRSLAVRSVAYLRSNDEDTPVPQTPRQHYDANGHLVAQWDPRLEIASLTTVYGLGGAVLKADSVDAGWRLSLPGLAGEPLRRWDERGNQWRTTFHNQLRVVAVEENDEADVDAFTYADGLADAGHNLRGQLRELKDRSGTLRTDSFALPGQPLTETRTFRDAEAFTSHRVLSPLGATLEQTDAGGHRQQSRYGLAGQLKHVRLLVSGQSDWQAVLLDAQYNAADQIIEQQAGNGVRSLWTYDQADGRLRTQSNQKDAGPLLQSLEYFHDSVGNIIRIEDHVFQPAWFANQLVDGHRDFTYDSLYRLASATGYDDGPLSDIPGLPQPTDPNNRLNYTQTYTYDAGGNLEKLVHVRDGASHTVQMCIDSTSNRGVRWKPGDPPPEFEKLFDRHGNQQVTQPGQAMRWSARDELQSVTLIAREDGRDDAEYYHYSQGVRVFKRHETFSDSAEHFHQVRYLPGLEIRDKDNGEELHVISVGGARCLHWAKNPPRDIENDQLRYSLDDHLGSCIMELDKDARVISSEGYYPFGATAWMAARSVIEVGYRFIHFSGKELDISGLYYYGARYYAPWLQRWVSPDPAGDVDGLNLYGFVGKNPMVYVDQTGTSRILFDLAKRAVGIFDKAKTATDQLHNLTSEFDGLIPEGADIEELRKNMTLGKFLKSRHGIKSAFYGAGKGAAIGSVLGTAVPGIGNAIGTGVGAIVGAIVFPLLRYYFFKKGLKLAQTLHTQELKDRVSAAGNAVSSAMEAGKDLLRGGAQVFNGLKNLPETLKEYSQDARDTFNEGLKALTNEQKLKFYSLLEDNVSPFQAMEKAKSVIENVPGIVSEAAQANDRLQQLERSIIEEPRPRPVPKPRTKFIRRVSVGETYV
ncbi:toxin [Pseudomonas sp. N40(2020)]|uniref:RHS repeat-associated core domain-containing protein n=1 Tax=Pseudomonas sp. N40(2020) TaxID=2767798 RepID=UPI001656D6BC|nr:toxin [Pseudomonas sp. N40(2020)]